MLFIAASLPAGASLGTQRPREFEEKLQEANGPERTLSLPSSRPLPGARTGVLLHGGHKDEGNSEAMAPVELSLHTHATASTSLFPAVRAKSS